MYSFTSDLVCPAKSTAVWHIETNPMHSFWTYCCKGSYPFPRYIFVKPV
jgi:hypothetical protein